MWLNGEEVEPLGYSDSRRVVHEVDTLWYGSDEVYTYSSLPVVHLVSDSTSPYDTTARNQFRAALEDYGLHYSTAEELPFRLDLSGITIASGLFAGCAKLRSVPDLGDTGHITSMSTMFNGCTSLKEVPYLNMYAGGAGSTASNSFASMFLDCHSLEYVPTSYMSRYSNCFQMFRNCRSLTDDNVHLIIDSLWMPSNTNNMIWGSGLTRYPFYRPDGSTDFNG